jgi:ribonuclease I
MTSTWRYSSLLAALLLPVSAAQADELQAKQYTDFDSYVLALSWQTGFCQSQHERNRQEPDECRLQRERRQSGFPDRSRFMAQPA